MTKAQLQDMLDRQANQLPQDPGAVKLLLEVLHAIAGNFHDGMPLRKEDQCQFCWRDGRFRQVPHAPDCVAPLLDVFRYL